MPVQHALRRFEKELLSQTGYGLILHQEAESSRPVDAHTQLSIPAGAWSKTFISSALEDHQGKEQGINYQGEKPAGFSS